MKTAWDVLLRGPIDCMALLQKEVTQPLIDVWFYFLKTSEPVWVFQCMLQSYSSF